MSLIELFLIAVGLSMDAFAVSICKGLSVRSANFKHYLITGACFGGFQALMPLTGYFLGASFQSAVEAFDHWIAFILLGLIGFNMIKESRGCAEELNDSFAFSAMLPLAVATSIDALAVGVSFAFLPDVSIVPAVSFIGIITFTLSAFGIAIGNRFGSKYKSKAEFVGGAILIIMGLKILLEHLGIICF